MGAASFSATPSVVFCLRSFSQLFGNHGQRSAAVQGDFVRELVTICKQLTQM